MQMNYYRALAEVILDALMSLCVLFIAGYHYYHGRYVASGVFLLVLVVSESADKIADAIKGNRR